MANRLSLFYQLQSFNMVFHGVAVFFHFFHEKKKMPFIVREAGKAYEENTIMGKMNGDNSEMECEGNQSAKNLFYRCLSLLNA